MWLQEFLLTYVVNIYIPCNCGLSFVWKKISLICYLVVGLFFNPMFYVWTFEPVPIAVDVKPVNLSFLLLEKNSNSKEGNGLSASEKNDTISGFWVPPWAPCTNYLNYFEIYLEHPLQLLKSLLSRAQLSLHRLPADPSKYLSMIKSGGHIHFVIYSQAVCQCLNANQAACQWQSEVHGI